MIKKRGIGLGLAAVLGAVGLAHADEAEQAVESTPQARTLSVGFETGVATSYVFRGIPQYNGQLDPSSQTSLTLTLDRVGPGTASVSLWNATAMRAYDSQPNTKLEFDVTAAYSLPISERVDVTFSYISYLYPEAATVAAAHELGVGASYDAGPFTSFVQFQGEFVQQNGAYAAAGVQKGVTLAGVELSALISVGFAGYQGTPFGLNDISTAVTGSWSFTEASYIKVVSGYGFQGASGLGALGDRSTFWSMIAFGTSLF